MNTYLYKYQIHTVYIYIYIVIVVSTYIMINELTWKVAGIVPSSNPYKSIYIYIYMYICRKMHRIIY